MGICDEVKAVWRVGESHPFWVWVQMSPFGEGIEIVALRASGLRETSLLGGAATEGRPYRKIGLVQTIWLAQPQ
jgi:hypothetical protein